MLNVVPSAVNISKKLAANKLSDVALNPVTPINYSNLRLSTVVPTNVVKVQSCIQAMNNPLLSIYKSFK